MDTVKTAEKRIEVFSKEVGPAVEKILKKEYQGTLQQKVNDAEFAKGGFVTREVQLKIEDLLASSTPRLTLDKLIADEQATAERRKKSLSEIEKILKNPALAEQYAITVLTEFFDDPKRIKAIRRAIAHLEGRTMVVLPIGFVDGAGQGHMFPLLYTTIERDDLRRPIHDQHGAIVGYEKKKIVRVVDPMTGARYDGKTLEDAMNEYSKRIAIDGLLVYKIDEAVHKKEITVSNTLKEEIDNLMKFLATTSMVALIAPDVTITKVYAGFAGGVSALWYGYKGAMSICEHIKHGTFDLTDPMVRLDLATVAAGIVTRGKIITGVKIGGLLLLASGAAHIGYDQINDILKDKKLNDMEKIKKVSETLAVFGGTVAVQIALRKRRATWPGEIKGEEAVLEPKQR